MADKIDFTVEDRHYDYLSIQRGDISDLRANREEWKAAYVDGLYRRFENIKPYLPAQAINLLDVGSGLGGINAVINKHYGGECYVHLIDGINDEPIVRTHSQTFNDMEVAGDFLAKNGVKYFGFSGPGQTVGVQIRKRFDVIVSFASYCFHYGPLVYKDFILNHSHQNTRFIFDVRKDKPEWQEQLHEFLTPVEVIWEGKKAMRIAYDRG